MIAHIQVTIGASATVVSSATLLVREVIFEAESGSSNVMAVGDSAVTTSTGFNIKHNTANIPNHIKFGPYECGPIDLAQIYIAGTASEKCNVHYVPL